MQHRGHADRLGALAVLAQVVDEHALGGLEPDALGAQLEDLRLRLVQPDLAGDHDAVEQLRERVAVVAAAAPRVRDQPGLQPGRPRAAQRLDHRLLRLHPGEQAVDESLVAVLAHAEQRAEQRRELLLGQLAGLEPAQQRQRLRVVAEQPA